MDSFSSSTTIETPIPTPTPTPIAPLSHELWERLRSVDTPTICNALEIIEGKRGFADFTKSPLIAVAGMTSGMETSLGQESDKKGIETEKTRTQATPKATPKAIPKSIVGYARTARIRASAPPTFSPDKIRAMRLDYYRYMSGEALKTIPSPAVFPQLTGPSAGAASQKNNPPVLTVIEDTDAPHSVGSFWGEVNTWVHKGFGIQAVLTNGLVRDLGDLAPEFEVFAAAVGPSHAFVHVLDFTLPVTVFGLNVSHGDLLHVDRHGAAIIPPSALPSLDKAIATLIENECVIIDAAKAGAASGGFRFADFEAAWNEFERRRT